MSQQYRRSLWGYRRRAVIEMVSEIHRQIEVAANERTRQLELAEEKLKAQENEKLDAEHRLNLMQAEYFRLSGELNHLTQRSQLIVEDAKNHMAIEESLVQNEIQDREDRLYQMRQRLYQLPSEIRHLIEGLTAVAGTVPPAPATRHAQDTASVTPHWVNDSGLSRGISGART